MYKFSPKVVQGIFLVKEKMGNLGHILLNFTVALKHNILCYERFYVRFNTSYRFIRVLAKRSFDHEIRIRLVSEDSRCST